MAGKVKFSLRALQQLVESDGSCVYCKESCTKSLALLPMHLKNFKSSVKELLASEVTTYDAELNGIILAHKFVKVINSVPLNDDGVLHVNYTADVYYFKPDVGSTLKGKVYKKSKDFVGVLVHSIFNVAVPKPRSESEESTWQGYRVSVGSNVVCRVVYLNFTGRLPYIRATLESVEGSAEPKRKKHKKEDGPGFKKIRIPALSAQTDQLDETACEEVSLLKVKKKKKKKDREKPDPDATVTNGALPPSPSLTHRLSTPEPVTPLSPKKKRQESSKTSCDSSKKTKIKLETPQDLKFSLVQEALLTLKREEETSSGMSTPVSSGKKRKRRSSESSSSTQTKVARHSAGDAVQSLLSRAMEGIGVSSSDDKSERKKKRKSKKKDLLE